MPLEGRRPQRRWVPGRGQRLCSYAKAHNSWPTFAVVSRASRGASRAAGSARLQPCWRVGRPDVRANHWAPRVRMEPGKRPAPLVGRNGLARPEPREMARARSACGRIVCALMASAHAPRQGSHGRYPAGVRRGRLLRSQASVALGSAADAARETPPRNSDGSTDPRGLLIEQRGPSGFHTSTRRVRSEDIPGGLKDVAGGNAGRVEKLSPGRTGRRWRARNVRKNRRGEGPGSAGLLRIPSIVFG